MELQNNRRAGKRLESFQDARPRLGGVSIKTSFTRTRVLSRICEVGATACAVEFILKSFFPTHPPTAHVCVPGILH